MAVTLQKGGNVSLTKEAPGIQKLKIGLGWDPRVTDGADFDLDASVFMIGADGKVVSDKHFIFYGNLNSPDGSVEHTGDNLTGDGEGDDEIVNVDLRSVPADVKKLVFAVAIYEADPRGQNFGQVANAFMRVVNQDGDKEIARYDLSEDYSVETALIFGEVYRHNDDWKFKAIGSGFEGGLGPLAASHGVNMG
jgi:tellurium resistance protein TerD